MQLLPGVGPASAQRALDAMAAHSNPMEALAAVPPPALAGEDWTNFVSMLRQVSANDVGWPAEMEAVRRWYEPHLKRIYEDAARDWPI